MKKILITLSILFSISAYSQNDSTALQLPLKLAIKAKFWAITGSYLTTKSPFSDTAFKCVGPGFPLDSVTTGTVRVGRFYQVFQRWISDPVGTNYLLLNELLTSSAANGGLIAQLNNYIANGTAAQKKIAQWLKSQLVTLMGYHSGMSDLQIANGISNLSALTNIITDN